VRSTLVKAQHFGDKRSNNHRVPNQFSFVPFWEIGLEWKQLKNHSIIKVATAA